MIAFASATKAPVGLSSDQTVCESRWRGLAPTSAPCSPFFLFLFLIRNFKRQPDQRPCFCAQRSGAFGVKEQPCAKKSFFGIYPLIFSAGRATISVVSSCKSDDADKLSSRSSMTQRGLPRKGAASSLPCAGALPPQSAEENLCRVRPLQHSEWHAEACNSGGTVERF